MYEDIIPERAAVSVIIPTAGAPRRHIELRRAIDSVIGQRRVAATPIVVLNGEGFSPEIFSFLRNNSRIRFAKIPDASVSKARLAGRRLFDTPYFSLLDDDDEILPEGLARCLGHLDPLTDVVAGNGHVDIGGQRQIAFHKFTSQIEPGLALMSEQWLTSGNALFRSSTVTESYFDHLPDILEWTFLALRLSLDRRITRIAAQVFVHYRGHADQVTTSERYYREAPDTLAHMLRLPVGSEIRRMLKRKLAAAHHDAASRELENGYLVQAWQYHLRSLSSLSGAKYLSFTRHLIFKAFQAR
jgi:glycosyltransferase involved in cell wall biosynthesis